MNSLLPDFHKHCLNALAAIPISQNRKIIQFHISISLIDERQIDL